jgi:hypothetical protein
MGKFKNKPVVVKDISWNEKGDLLINGKPALKMRIKTNEGLQEIEWKRVIKKGKIFKKGICPDNMKLVGKKCVRMTADELIKRKRASILRAKKMKAKMGKILKKRKKSLRRRQSMGLENVNEIGDASAKAYKWKAEKKDYDFSRYGFKTPSGLIYKVFFQDMNPHDISGRYEVTFTANGSDNEETNAGEMYSVMSTVVAIVKDFIKWNEMTSVITYTPIKRDKDDTRRAKLYNAYIKRQLGGSSKVVRQGDEVNIVLQKRNQMERFLSEVEDIYDKTIEYEYETPSGKKVKREITYGSVIAGGKDHPLYDQVKKEIEDAQEEKDDMNEVIRKSGSKWLVKSKAGKTLGTHDTKEKALAQLRAIEANK